MKWTILSPLAISAALLGCVSTTAGTDINPERKQLLIYSNAEMQRVADSYYRQTLAESRSRGVLDSNTTQVNRVRNVVSRLIPHVSLLRQDAAD